MANQTFGERLATLRKEKGLTQSDIADKLGITAQAVSKWENDQATPDIDCLVKLSDIFGISVDELLGKKKVAEMLPTPPTEDEIERMVFRIHIISHEGDTVNVNLPLALVKVFMNDDGSISMIDGNESLKNIDFRKLLDLVERGVVGELVSINSHEGDTVRICVEK